MKLSIITACLNSEKTIQKTIDSVLSQKLEYIEHVFVDGGSSDSTLDIVQRYIELVEKERLNIKIKVIFQKEKTGITGAWNIALKEITGDIIHILNSDDWYELDALTSVLDIFDKYPDVGIAYASAYFSPAEGNKFIRYCRPLMFFPFLMPLVHPATFVRRSVFEKVGIFDETYSISSDYDFVYRCYKDGIKLRKIRKPLVNMLLGGFANSNRNIARKETLKIALKYSSLSILPYTAYWIRKLFKR